MATRKKHTRYFKRLPLFFAISLCVSGQIYANPENARVVDGSAEFNEQGDSFTVNQHSDRVLIDYDDFSIAEHETVEFIQPSASAIAVNRVTGANPSEIFGQLDANGQVFLINSNGIMFSETARLNVGALGATTLDFHGDSLEDSLLFSAPKTGSGISNAGEINATSENGYVAFISPNIENSGNIRADNGSVSMVSASTAVVTLSGEMVGIETELHEEGRISNEGEVRAGQTVVMNSESVDNLYDTLITNSGSIQATGFAMVDGKIQLVAKGGDILNQGEISANATQQNRNGGSVDMSAERIANYGEIYADAKGKGSGGSINVYATELINVLDKAKTSANADTDGDGGNIYYYSETNAYFNREAFLSATGGTITGDGGFIEFSGVQNVVAYGRADTRALNDKGITGSFLIDPVDIEITTLNQNGAFDPPGTAFTWNASANVSRIFASDITTNLATSNVIIDSSQSVPPNSASGAVFIQADIDINGAGGNNFTILARNGIVFNPSTKIYDSDAGTLETGTVTLQSSVPGASIVMDTNSIIDVSGGKLVINTGGATLTGISSLNTDADSISITATSGINDANAAAIDFTTPGGLILNAATGITSIETNVAGISVSNAGISPVSITESDGIVINALSSATDVSITTIGGGGDVIEIDDGGISVSADLMLTTGGDIKAVSNRAPTITADTLTINANNLAGDLTFNTTVNSLDINTVGANLSILESDGLTLTDADVGAADLALVSTAGDINVSGFTSVDTFTANAIIGNVQIPEAGITANHDISLSGNDIVDDSGRALTLNSNTPGSQLFFSANTPAGDTVINTNANINTFDINLGTGEVDTLTLNPASNGITISDIDISAGSLQSTLSNGDITISNTTNLNNLDLTASNGNVIIPDAGLTAVGALDITAQDLVDSDRTITIIGNTATLNLLTPANDLTINSTLSNIDLTIGNTSNIVINETDGLTLTDANLSGGLDITTATGNITIDAITSVMDLGLDASLGDIILPTAGFNSVGALSLTAQDMFDVDAGAAARELQISATTSDISLTAPAADLILNTALASLDLSVGNSSNITINETDAISLTDINLPGNLNVTAVTSDITVDVISAVTDLNLAALSGDIIIPSAGLNPLGQLTLAAQDIYDLDAGAAARDLQLSGTATDLSLSSPSGDLNLNTAVTSLDLDIGNTVNLTVLESNGLTVADVNTLGDLTLRSATGNIDITALTAVENISVTATSGNIQIPEAGLGANANISLSANDITDTAGRDLNFFSTAANAVLDFHAETPAADIVINTNPNIDTFDLSLGSSAVEEIILNSTSTDTTFTDISGSLQTVLNNGNVTINSVTDLAELDLTVTNGSLQIPDTGLIATGNISINAQDLFDSDRTLVLQGADGNINLTSPTAALTLTTSFDTLSLQSASTGNFIVNEADAITLQDINIGGDLDINLAAGDLTLNALTSTDSLSLNLAAGNVLIPATGISTTGNLFISAGDLFDSDAGAAARELLLAGASADLNLSAPASDIVLQTVLDSVNFSLGNSAAVSVNEADNISLLDANMLGDLDITSATGNIAIAQLTAVNNFTGTATGGDIQIPDAGLNAAGTLSLTAQDIVDSDRDLILNAISAQLNIIAPVGETIVNLGNNINDITLQTGTTVTESLVINHNSGDLIFNDIDMADATLLANINSGSATVANITALENADFNITNGNLLIPATGLQATGSLAIEAQDIIDTDAGADARNIALSATDADIALAAPADNLVLNTSFDSLLFSNAGSNNVTLLESDDIQLDSLESALADYEMLVSTGDLVIGNIGTVNNINLGAGTGNIVLPSSGISATGNIRLQAIDIFDADAGTEARELQLTGDFLSFNASAPAGDFNLNTSVNQLQVVLGAQSNLNIDQTGDLIISGDGTNNTAIQVADGNFSLAQRGNLRLLDNVTVSDLTDDNIRAGLINIQLINGNLSVGSDTVGRDTRISSINTVDADEGSALLSNDGEPLALLISNRQSTGAYDITLGNGVNSAVIEAQGGDIRVESVRSLDLAENSQVFAYNNTAGASGGEVFDNSTSNLGSVAAETGRKISLRETLLIPLDNTPVDDVISDIVDDTNKKQDSDSGNDGITDNSSSSGSGEITALLGINPENCKEFADEKMSNRCRKQTMLENFLGMLWIGGELPDLKRK